MKHTPTPWGISKIYHRSEWNIIIPKAHENRHFGGNINPKISREKYAWYIARCLDGPGISKQEAEGNVDFILKACNAHECLVLERDALLKAAEHARYVLHRFSSDETGKAFAQLNKAIALCEENNGPQKTPKPS